MFTYISVIVYLAALVEPTVSKYAFVLLETVCDVLSILIYLLGMGIADISALIYRTLKSCFSNLIWSAVNAYLFVVELYFWWMPESRYYTIFCCMFSVVVLLFSPIAGTRLINIVITVNSFYRMTTLLARVQYSPMLFGSKCNACPAGIARIYSAEPKTIIMHDVQEDLYFNILV